ncbi:MAG: hypothetical protein V1862_08320 [Methanobacteriota archaeon]
MSERRNINLFLTDILTACEKVIRYAGSIHQEDGICDEKIWKQCVIIFKELKGDYNFKKNVIGNEPLAFIHV